MSGPVSITLERPADYDEWRRAARALLARGVAPDRVGFRLASDSGDLFDSLPAEQHTEASPVSPRMRVPRDFVSLAKTVICHSDAGRFALLYRLLWRLRHEARLLDNGADPDVFNARRMAKSVRRDSHKMKAFVRFRCTTSEVGEVFVAWFEPDHHIVERTAPFFARRFAGMRWSIVTPECSAHWDGDRVGTGTAIGGPPSSSMITKFSVMAARGASTLLAEIAARFLSSSRVSYGTGGRPGAPTTLRLVSS